MKSKHRKEVAAQLAHCVQEAVDSYARKSHSAKCISELVVLDIMKELTENIEGRKHVRQWWKFAFNK